MTIKEVESLSGMTRANIRFYEAEGLLTPQRLANQYRDYTEENLETLKRIKLLRSLQISLEDIKTLHAGNGELSDMLDRHLERLQQEKEDIDSSQEVCRAMRRDGVCYQTLDAQHYLDALESQAGQGRNIQSPGGQNPDCLFSFQTDMIPEDRVLWRRYFARTLDLNLYMTVWQILLLLVFHVNILRRGAWSSLLDLAVGVLLMLALEPILLVCFGTTPGKWVLGLAVTDCEGRRLTYEQARDRTRQVLWQGAGFYLPIYGIIRHWKSYQEKQDWEFRTEMIRRDQRGWRVAAYIGANLLLVAGVLLSYQIAKRPVHRGDITVEEFCENYNQLAEFYHIDSGKNLDSRGQWIGGNSPAFGGSEALTPDFRFAEEEGAMTGMEFTVDLTGSDDWINGYGGEMFLSILSFAGAQKEGSWLFSETDRFAQTISRDPFAGFEISVNGVRITCEVQYSGYYDMGTMLIPEENPRFFLKFSMQRQAIFVQKSL